MLYAPDLPRDYTGMGKDFSDVVFKDGILITKRGGPVVIAHTWWGLAYDPVQRSMYFMNTWVTNQKKCVEQLGGDPGQLYTGPPLWSFTPSTCDVEDAQDGQAVSRRPIRRDARVHPRRRRLHLARE